MCNKAVKNYPHALEFVLECYKTQNMCDKAINTYPSTIEIAPECYKTMILFLINIKLKKCVTQLFLMILL